MAPIDPSQLLKALDSLLSSEGGIRSSDEVTRLASLMKKFSRKLVSRCVYCNVLQATKPDILSNYLDKGGWETINSWLQDAKDSSHCFLLEMLHLCKLLPMTVARLKENNTAKLIKSLTKHENSDIKSISSELVSKWMLIIKDAKSSDSTADKKKKKSKAEKGSKTIEKAQSSSPKSTAKIKGTKRSSSEKESKNVEYYEDVKIDPEPLLSPVSKKPRADRPKTAKLYQKKFRATGLEEETPLPKNIAKKTSSVNKNVAAAAAKNAAKMMSSSLPDRINEKKLKPENLMTINENTGINKGIKLIPAKPRPHILHESASFMDALISQPIAPVKRKKKAQPNKVAISPTITPPNLQFYKETLEISDENESKGVESSVENKSENSTDDANCVEPMDATNDEGGQTPTNDADDGIASLENDMKVEDPANPNRLRSILAHGKRRGRKKTVKWVDDTILKEVFFFELDETERVNVLRNQNFGDLKSIEVKREREAFELAKRHAGDKMEETIPWWVIPILIDIPPALVEPGFQSKEKEIQKIRQQSTLQEIYFTREMIPEAPHEPDHEAFSLEEPKVIPLDEENSTGAILDYSSFERALKPALPEVLTSLMKIPSSRPSIQSSVSQDQIPVDCGMLSAALQNPNILNQQSNVHPMPIPYDSGEALQINNSGLMGMPPHMHNMFIPQNSEDEKRLSPSEWRTLEMIQQEQFFGFPMNPGMMNDSMSAMNMRPRIMHDMFRPGMHKGPMPRSMGPLRGRGIPRVPCRHFIAGGCRFGVKCNFLHPGVNGPPL